MWENREKKQEVIAPNQMKWTVQLFNIRQVWRMPAPAAEVAVSSLRSILQAEGHITWTTAVVPTGVGLAVA